MEQKKALKLSIHSLVIQKQDGGREKAEELEEIPLREGEEPAAEKPSVQFV